MIDLLDLRNGAAVLSIGDDDLPGIHQSCRNFARHKRRRHHHTRQPLAIRNHVVGCSRREFAHGTDAAEQLFERLKLGLQFRVKFGE